MYLSSPFLRQMGHDESQRARPEGLHERGMLGIKLAGLVHDRGVLLLGLFRQLLDRLG